MFAVIATMVIKKGEEQEFMAAFSERRRRVLASERAALQYDLYAKANAPQEFVAIERFTSRAAYDLHIAGSNDHQGMMACFAAPPTAILLDQVPGCS